MGISRSFVKVLFIFEILLLISLHILYVYDTELIHLLNLRRYALSYANKDFLDGDIESSIVFNLEEISLHKEGPNATIILLYSLPVVWFSLLDVESYNFAAYIYRKNVLFNNRSYLDDAILDENDNSSGRYCCRVLIARR